MSVVVLTGGIGGAKLVLGLLRVLPPASITAIVNTGDDFRHLGLYVSPDIDTLLYTLSGKASTELGWGRAGETWSFMAAARELGAADWFALGDGDLALHVVRTFQLERGASLSEVTAAFARAFGLGLTVLPMSDDPVATWLETDEGALAFQRYFVQRRCEPRVRTIRFDSADAASPAPGVVDAIERADAVIVAPSNPYLSVDPILAVPGVRAALARTGAPVVAVSPLVGGKAVKGPTAKLMGELGVTVGNEAVAERYRDFVDGLLIDEGDPPPAAMPHARTATLMATLDDRERVARAALGFARALSPR